MTAKMNGMSHLRFWLRSLFQKRTLDSEMEEEMRFHVEMETAANVESGMNREEARYAALKKFGVGLGGMALACLGLANKAEAAGRCDSCIKRCLHDNPTWTADQCRLSTCSSVCLQWP